MAFFVRIYLKYTCESINCNKTNVKNLIHSTQARQICSNVKSILNIHNFTFCCPSHQSRLYTNGKKIYHTKKLTQNSNERKSNKQMSDSLKPTFSHVSYGGQFEVSTDNDSAGNEWRKSFASSESTNSENSKESCPIPPDFRVWEQVLKRNDTSDNGNSFQFKILSYNVLAQYLIEYHPYLYTECAPHNLKWQVRAARLYDEIVKLTPDIICLQEVQASHLSSFYSKFEEIGYFGIFKQKTGQRQDGCAIYFKQSLFEMWDHVTVEYYQPGLPILNRDNIGVIAKLMPKNYSGPPIVVATTHLLYNPKRTDVRLAQLQVLLAELDRFAYYNTGIESGHLPIILTGDFNSTPDSAVITLLDRGCVRAGPFRDTSDWQKIGVTDNCQHLSVYLNRLQGQATDFCMTKIHNSDYREYLPEPSSSQWDHNEHSDLFNNSIISHSLNFSSTYNKFKSDGCHEATTFQDFWVTVDYIYFSLNSPRLDISLPCRHVNPVKNPPHLVDFSLGFRHNHHACQADCYCSTLRLVERLRLPTALECNVLGKLPNDVYGSDHLALVAVFELKPR